LRRLLLLMQVFWLVVGVLGASPSFADVNPNVASAVCRQTAERKGMSIRAIAGQRAVRDGRGAMIGRQIDMDVTSAGREILVSCYYDGRTGTALFADRKPAGVTPVAPGTSRQAIAACQTAAKAQRLMVGNTLSDQPLRNRRGEIVGRSILLEVYQAGRPAQLVCDYTFATGDTGLQLRRPAPR
jgi:hypothetical protein